ncbi:MAG TPA: hypothetical protein VHQ03_02550, partial [Candidatus Dormibacteraeota bacterium]|nr:hypothetical protein [Candidatus Dormibacteraeota bacterium]
MKPSLSALRLLFAAGFVASSMGASGVTASAHGVAARTAVPLPASRLEFGLSNFDTTWMNSSGVPWRYRFQYLSSGVNTGTGWETWNSPLGQFAVNYMNASTTAPANYIPVFTYYELLQSLPSTGADEKSRDYNNLNTASTMAAYYGNFKLLMQKAGAYGSQVVVHVEPDFWAYMQQIANGGTASSVSASVKGSGFAEASAFPDTLAGFAAELKYLRDTYAPNVALAMHASMWSSGFDLATNTDPTLNPVAEADKTAAFLNSAGGNTWDALFNDLDDHNAAWWELVGGNPYHWWDPNNVNFPNFSRYLSWVGELHTKTAVPQVAWQVPEGNQYFLTLNNTCGHYQDNVAPYFISHPGDLFNAGLIAVLFGPGNACQTNYDDTQADGITNNNGVPTTDLLGGCNACNTQTSTVSDDDGGYLRIFVGRYYAGQGTCFDVRLSASPGSPQASGAPVSINAAAAGCPHPLYQFWTLAPGATSWQVAQPYSTTASLPWQTTGLSPGTYQVAVWAKDSTSNGAYGNAFGRWDAFNSLPYTLVSPICTALHLSAAPPSPAGVGSPVVFTANGTCPDANPVYQFWTLAPGATSWTNVQPYSTTNTFSWSTVGKTPAGYQVAVWVRDASSPGAYSNVLGTFDLSSSIAYGLTTCASAGLSAMPGTTAGVGTPVNFTATAAGCPSPSPMYQFWVLAPGASGWTVAQPYSTSNTFGWST